MQAGRYSVLESRMDSLEKEWERDEIQYDFFSGFFAGLREREMLVCMEIYRGLVYNSDVGNKQDVLICKEETVP